MDEDMHSVGERCHFDNNYGTVRYVGKVDGTDGFWYGIEWDSERGKHDGSHGGVRYFICSPGFGSFVRAQKIQFGTTPSEAIHHRYGENSMTESDSSPIILQETMPSQAKNVEMVGFDKIISKQSNFTNMKEVDLSRLHISSVKESDELEILMPNVKDLNLSSNLICSLNEIVKMCGQLKKLTILNISSNIISNFTVDAMLKEGACFQSLSTLYVNKMKLEWNMLTEIVSLAKNLKKLHACFNEVKSISSDISHFHGIELLNCEGNAIEDWNEVLKLSQIESLESIILNDNKIKEVHFTNDNGGSGCFENLKSISLNDNLIEQWSSINQLNILSSLEDLRFKNNPVCKGMTSFDLRQELIGRVRNVKILNGSPVPLVERKTAELAYLKKYSQEWWESKSNSSLTQFCQSHPRYEDLVNVHGAPANEAGFKTKSLKQNLISISIMAPDNNTKPKVEKNVPATMTVQQLKGIIQRLFKVASSKQRLSYLDSKTSREVEMDDNLRQISYYSISSGDTVCVRW